MWLYTLGPLVGLGNDCEDHGMRQSYHSNSMAGEKVSLLW